MKQKKLTMRGSKALFRKTALKTHKLNVRPPSSRGGIRL